MTFPAGVRGISSRSEGEREGGKEEKGDAQPAYQPNAPWRVKAESRRGNVRATIKLKTQVVAVANDMPTSARARERQRRDLSSTETKEGGVAPRT